MTASTVVTTHHSELATADRIAATADALAKEGWSLVTVCPNPPDARFVLVFSRQEVAA